MAVARGNCCSHGSNRAGNSSCWCRSPTRLSKPHTGPSLVFLPRTRLPLPLKGEGRDFAHLWGFGFSLAVAFGNRWPQLAHTGPTGPVWGFGGVVSLSCPLTGQKSPHRAGFVFPPQNELTPPPKGGGVGYRLSWIRRVCPARSKLGHVGPTGPVRSFGGLSPTRSQNRTQGHTGPSLVSPPFSPGFFRR